MQPCDTIGSHLCERLLAEGNDIICIDNYFTGHKSNIRHLLSHPNFEIIRHDIVYPYMAEIEEIVAKNPDSVVIVDEAYVDFGGVSALPLVDKYENLLIVQTFSKSRALAGMRIGFAIGQKKLISYLNDVKFSFNSYTMNRLTIACGKACVEDRGYFQEITGKIVATREWTKQKLAELGFTFPDSKANFIFATHKTVPAQELFENLKTAGIYVRYFKKPRIDNYLRITVGTQAEMERLVEVLAELVK